MSGISSDSLDLGLVDLESCISSLLVQPYYNGLVSDDINGGTPFDESYILGMLLGGSLSLEVSGGELYSFDFSLDFRDFSVSISGKYDYLTFSRRLNSGRVDLGYGLPYSGLPMSRTPLSFSQVDFLGDDGLLLWDVLRGVVSYYAVLFDVGVYRLGVDYSWGSKVYSYVYN